jgi:uncharacterized protein
VVTSRKTVPTIEDSLRRYDRLVEVGVGRRADLAAALVEAGRTVIVTDVHNRDVPDGVRFVRDDVVDPDPAIYTGADAIYARNLPPELHRPALDLAHRVGAGLLFTTLGGDQPAVPVERRTVQSGTLYVAHTPR